MRIITGIARGRRIKAPEGLKTRPTLDRVKESLFNIISSKIYDSTVLDLFAGSGNLGLEALSRGARFCTFVECDRNTFRFLKENIEMLDFIKKCELYNQDAFSALRKISSRNLKYNIIFLDPPYGKGLIEKSIEYIDEMDLLDYDGIVVSEYDEKDMIPEKIGKMKLYRTEKYGRVKISFWAKEEENDKDSSIPGKF